MNNKINLAPIALFTYNRPWHAQQTVEALQKNDLAIESDLFIFSDGAKNTEDQYRVNEVRKYLKTISGFKSVTIEESPINKGLANSIIYGVTKIVDQFGKIIVLEDDLVTSKSFLKFVNDGLNIYEKYPQVAMIHAHMYNVSDLPETFFSYKVGCLGWGTWRDRWSKVSFEGSKLLKLIIEKSLTSKFDLDNSYPYTQMLKDQISKKNNSWAIRVYASFFLQNMLIYYAGKSHLKHIGFDSGTHHQIEGKSTALDGEINQFPSNAQLISINNNAEANKKIAKLYKHVLRPSLIKRMINKITRMCS